MEESEFVDLIDMDEEVDAEDKHAFAPARLFSVALVGALVSLGAYYMYQQLEPEKKRKLKKQATSMIQEQIHSLTEVEED